MGKVTFRCHIHGQDPGECFERHIGTAPLGAKTREQQREDAARRHAQQRRINELAESQHVNGFDPVAPLSASNGSAARPTAEGYSAPIQRARESAERERAWYDQFRPYANGAGE